MDDIAENHHVPQSWDTVMALIRQAMVRADVHPARTVLLLPYVQLIPVARAAWARLLKTLGSDAHFVPRFETTMTWSRTLGGFEPLGDDLRMDAARDVLTAAFLLDRAGMDAGQPALAGRLMEAAWSLAGPAAAVPPRQRAAWGARLAAVLLAQGLAPMLEVEARLGHVALAWAASSSYRTDILFQAEADLLGLLEGWQVEPLHETLHSLWGERALVLKLDSVGLPPATPRSDRLPGMQQAVDLEDEAERAGACVLAHLARGHAPVALVAQDRVVTRRVRALLGERGVAVRDETGWTLSTTRAAASLVGLLRAAAWDASTDAVLDWAKNAPVFSANELADLEVALRRKGVRDWRRTAMDDAVTGRIEAMRSTLQSARPLSAWLDALRGALQDAGQWPVLVGDPAGQAVLDALRLRSGAEQEFSDLPSRMGQTAFVAWVNQALEAGSFLPPSPEAAQVVILPVSQLLGRSVAAVVFPGCDELRLPTSPEPPGMWTPAQRLLLGLPSRDALAAATRATWHYALRAPHVDLLWRSSESGEPVMPSPLVQELLLAAPTLVSDPRTVRVLAPLPGHMPQPSGAALPLARLSASAYEDLRRCPYRFFALRQLGLQQSDELDTEVDKRDFGNWLHAVLRHFHEALADASDAGLQSRLALMDLAVARATRELGLTDDEFLPFAAAWPRVRAGYLRWLDDHEAHGARFVQAEAGKKARLGHLTLAGRIDRIDHLADGSTLVIDYKTEARGKTSERIKSASEDIQLAFYAALLEDDTLAAQYLHIGEGEGTRSYPQADIVELRDQLLQGIQHDMQRIDDGAPLSAIGEGSACEFCVARGLCRKDFWETGPASAGAQPDV